MTVRVRFTGGCHCGSVSFTFETSRRPEDLQLRACTCSFCARHGARTVTDPSGRVRFHVRDPAALVRYRFGLKTAEFLLCARCGVYVGAWVEIGDRHWATVNANTLEPRLVQSAQPVSYDGETAEVRLARRRSNWTPAEMEVVHP
jgi:hypothetical protein